MDDFKEPSIEPSPQMSLESFIMNTIELNNVFQDDLRDTNTPMESNSDATSEHPIEISMELDSRSPSEESIIENSTFRVQSARKGTGGKSKNDDEEARLAKIQRTYEQLSFSKPGKAFADIGISERGKRREVVEKKAAQKKTKPHYDAKGQFIHPDFSEPIRMCDCLTRECDGCFPPCQKCSSRMCGPICQANRSMIPISITVNGAGGKITKNPLINEKPKKQKDYEMEDEVSEESSTPDTSDSEDPEYP